MQLPFTTGDFLELMRAYNDAIGPTPIMLSAAAIAAALLTRTRFEWRHRAITAVLAGLWLWAGAVYHLAFFTRINTAARLFGVAFIVQAILLGVYALRRRGVQYTPRRNWPTVAGVLLIVYSIAVYPLLGLAAGHGYPNGPSFGAPCPVTLFFLGMMLFASARGVVGLLVIPLAWAGIGTSAAVVLGIREDMGLAVGGILVIAAMLSRVTRARSRSPSSLHASRA